MKKTAATLIALALILACSGGGDDGSKKKEAFCGDGACNANESCSTCPSDCGTCPPPPPWGVTLVWEPRPPEEGVEGYRVYMGTESGQYTEHWETAGTEIRVGGLEPGATYYFAATSFRGDEESAFSDELEVR